MLNFLHAVDLAQLNPSTTKQDIYDACNLAVDHDCATVCVCPSHVEPAVQCLRDQGSKIPVCSVVGFPSGFHRIEDKVNEAIAAIALGAEEIDFVISRAWVYDRDWQIGYKELHNVTDNCHARQVRVKAILETCYLTMGQIVRVSSMAADCGVEWVKTSTGFGTQGAEVEVVKIMLEAVNGKCQVKASGGIKTRASAERFLELGCTRLGIGVKSLQGILNEKQ